MYWTDSSKPAYYRAMGAALTLLFSAAVTFVIQSEAPVRPGLQHAMERELAPRPRLVMAAAVGPTDSFQELVVVKFHGNCELPLRPRPVPPIAASAQPLGWVQRIDGQFLSIIHIDCQRIAEALARIVPQHSPDADEIFARAIARVVRHEMRHLSLNTDGHERTGENKASLRGAVLAAPAFGGRP
jgi:hypothetical protein